MPRIDLYAIYWLLKYTKDGYGVVITILYIIKEKYTFPRCEQSTLFPCFSLFEFGQGNLAFWFCLWQASGSFVMLNNVNVLSLCIL